MEYYGIIISRKFFLQVCESNARWFVFYEQVAKKYIMVSKITEALRLCTDFRESLVKVREESAKE